MEALREVTVWEGVAKQPNHIYLMDGSKAVAYIPWGEGKPFYFKSGLALDKRGRKFVAADKKLFKEHKDESTRVAVTGSKGQVYYVDPEAKTCTCPGFTYRGACKHLDQYGSVSV